MCLGQHLARLELQIGLLELLRRFPHMQLAVPAMDLHPYGPGDGFLRLRELPVAW